MPLALWPALLLVGCAHARLDRSAYVGTYENEFGPIDSRARVVIEVLDDGSYATQLGVYGTETRIQPPEIGSWEASADGALFDGLSIPAGRRWLVRRDGEVYLLDVDDQRGVCPHNPSLQAFAWGMALRRTAGAPVRDALSLKTFCERELPVR